MTKKQIRAVKDAAARRWNRDDGKRPIWGVWLGEHYSRAFALHDAAYLAGYRAALRQHKRKRP